MRIDQRDDIVRSRAGFTRLDQWNIWGSGLADLESSKADMI